ncbi:MAG: NosD domain-containing protein, partial [Candidatus Bathyarchaeia archaeon]
CTEITISKNNVTANTNDGITLRENSGNNTVCDNNLIGNRDGIYLYNAHGNTVARNNIIETENFGIELFEATNNLLTANHVKNGAKTAIAMALSSNNTFCLNSFINNMQQADLEYCGTNFWDNGREGNYWSNLATIDLDEDGIGDVAYTIEQNNTDFHPLMGPCHDFTVTYLSDGCEKIDHILIISNSTITDFTLEIGQQLNESQPESPTRITFYATGEEGNTGFCRVTIPRNVLNGSYIVLVGPHEVSARELGVSNSTHACLYFTYEHSTLQVVIISEFPLSDGLLFLILTLFLVCLFKYRICWCKTRFCFKTVR